MKLAKTIIFTLVVIACSQAMSLRNPQDYTHTVEFDGNGRALQNAGKCNVEQWAEVVQDIVATSAPGVGHRYVVDVEPCMADKYAGMKPEGVCCNQRTARTTYVFKKQCTIDALLKTCGGATEHHGVMKVILYRQCDSCKAAASGCAAFGFCNLPNPYSNEMPAAMMCDRMCQPSLDGCRPRHIFSELTNTIADKMQAEERHLIEMDDDYQELRLRCASQCVPTTDNFACVVSDKAHVQVTVPEPVMPQIPQPHIDPIRVHDDAPAEPEEEPVPAPRMPGPSPPHPQPTPQ